jgi:hypothetical protein
MKNHHQSFGLTLGLDFLVSDNWMPEQAWAVVELLDDLRGRIWSHYLIPIQKLLSEDRGILRHIIAPILGSSSTLLTRHKVIALEV